MIKGLTKRRMALLCAGLGATGAVSAATFGATSATFTSTGATQTNSITDGTVVLAGLVGSTSTLTIPALNPGDYYCTAGYFPAGHCPGYPSFLPTSNGGLYGIKYTGTSPAFVGLDFHVSSTAAKPCTLANGANSTLAPSTTGIAPAAVTAACSGASADGTMPSFNGDGAALTLISASSGPSTGQIPLLTPTQLNSAASCSTDAASVVTCVSNIDNIEMQSFTQGPSANHNAGNDYQWPGDLGGVGYSQSDIAVAVGLPISATNAFQGSGATIALTAHAVQWANNLASVTSGSPNTATCDAATFLPSVLADGSGDTWCPASWS